MTTGTYRDLAWSILLEVIDEAARDTPRRDEFGAALKDFQVRFDAAIDAVPVVASLLDQPEGGEPSSDEIVDPINRADEFAAHMAGKLHDR